MLFKHGKLCRVFWWFPGKTHLLVSSHAFIGDLCDVEENACWKAKGIVQSAGTPPRDRGLSVETMPGICLASDLISSHKLKQNSATRVLRLLACKAFVVNTVTGLARTWAELQGLMAPQPGCWRPAPWNTPSNTAQLFCQHSFWYCYNSSTKNTQAHRTKPTYRSNNCLNTSPTASYHPIEESQMTNHSGTFLRWPNYSGQPHYSHSFTKCCSDNHLQLMWIKQRKRNYCPALPHLRTRWS